jgi:hypothetical protein
MSRDVWEVLGHGSMVLGDGYKHKSGMIQSKYYKSSGVWGLECVWGGLEIVKNHGKALGSWEFASGRHGNVCHNLYFH